MKLARALLLVSALTLQSLPALPAEAMAPAVPAHPYLLADSSDFARLAAALPSDPFLAAGWARLKKSGERMLSQAPLVYELRDGVRLLQVSREALDRVYTLGLLWRVEGESRWKERLWAEAAALAAFPDWHPVHFLDTAEMTHAMAIAYDWLYADWTPERRRVIREAILKKGVAEAEKVWNDARRPSWSAVEHNWNLVCNGGVGLGILALAGGALPELAARDLALIRASMPRALKNYAPDGAWNESPAYWTYGTTYLVYFLEALGSATGTDWDFYAAPGLSRTADFALAVSGPGPFCFAYGDGSPSGIPTGPLLWALARRYGRPDWAEARRSHLASRQPEALDLLWGSRAAGDRAGATAVPLDMAFRRVELALFRSSWTDSRGWLLGLKGFAFSDRNHTDLDSGGFFIAGRGVRWADELGSDDYNLPGYFDMGGKKEPGRWSYYRKRTEGQNCILVNPGAGPGQLPGAAAPLSRFASGEGWAEAVVDLTAVYPGAAKAERRLRYEREAARAILMDEIRLDAPGEVLWRMHTQCDVVIGPDGRRVLLRKGAETILASLGPATEIGLRWELAQAVPLPGSPAPRQDPNKGWRVLTLRSSGAAEVDIEVVFDFSGGVEKP